MKTRRRYSALVAALALALLVPGAASAVADRESPGPQYPAESCYDAYVDCGYAQVETDVYTESSADYGFARGSCRTRWARATRRNLAWLVVFRYNEQVRWCWSGGQITYFWRDRWPSDTSFGWGFDFHIGSNCLYEHCPNRGVGTYSTDAWTQGQFHACLPKLCFYKYPLVDIWVHGDGGSGASASGA